MIIHLFLSEICGTFPDFLITVVFDRNIGLYQNMFHCVSSPQFSDEKLVKISQLIFGNVWYVAIYRYPTLSIITAICSLDTLQHLICDVMIIVFI
jgi:hypothetical protein